MGLLIAYNKGMNPNVVFNITVCIMGIAILLVHVINLLIKKNKRQDENRLLLFLAFTAFHFAVYLTFTAVKINFASDAFVIASYTTFFLFNNIEALLLFLYMLSCVEFENKTKKILQIINYSTFAVFVVLDIINVFTGIFFTSVDGEYTRASTMILSQMYQFIIFAIVLVVAFTNKSLVLREKIAFACYCLLPGAAIIFQNIFKGYAIAYASIIIAIEILFFFINVQKNIQIAQEQEKNKDAQVRLMMSQIQPHFIYNSLSSISTLICINPVQAQEALDDFTEYLRHNLSSLTEVRLIPFEDELNHVQTYVALEKVRFKERISIIYDIKVRDFYVPPLSIQPIVENAIKHGILKKLEGGTVIFKTYETEKAYVVEVIDDGIGFIMSDIKFEDNIHFGISNIKYRLKTMCNGSLNIISSPNNGARAIIKFYK